MNENSGYDAVLFDQDYEEISETHGSKGPFSTVFQSECVAIIVEGLTLLDGREDKELLIRTDNQADIKALASHVTTTSTVKTLKETLNRYGEKTKITIQWIKAHVGYKGNERADELAKLGSNTLPIGPEPNITLSKAIVHSIINREIHQMWQTRWANRTDARQTAIFFPQIDL